MSHSSSETGPHHAAPSAFFVSVQLAISEGLYHDAGSTTLFLSVRALQLNEHASSHLTFVRMQRGQDSVYFRNTEVESAKAAALMHAIRDSGLDRRDLNVEQVPDTSDSWVSIDLSVDLDGRRGAVHLSLAQSGYRGRDAIALRSLLNNVLALVGLSADEIAETLARARTS